MQRKGHLQSSCFKNMSWLTGGLGSFLRSVCSPEEQPWAAGVLICVTRRVAVQICPTLTQGLDDTRQGLLSLVLNFLCKEKRPIPITGFKAEDDQCENVFLPFFSMLTVTLISDGGNAILVGPCSVL